MGKTVVPFKVPFDMTKVWKTIGYVSPIVFSLVLYVMSVFVKVDIRNPEDEVIIKKLLLNQRINISIVVGTYILYILMLWAYIYEKKQLSMFLMLCIFLMYFGFILFVIFTRRQFTFLRI